MNNVGLHIAALMKQGGQNQSDLARAIGVSRQLLSYVIAGKRELSISLALKLESFFNLSEGVLLKMQTEERIKKYKLEIKEQLVESLNSVNAFWSYADVSIDTISNEELIEKTFTQLDIEDIALLFELYPRNYIRKVWRENMAVQGDYLFNLNVMIAMYYFDIKHPEQYLRRLEREHINKIVDYA